MQLEAITCSKRTVQIKDGLSVDITLKQSLTIPKRYDVFIEWEPRIPKKIKMEYIVKYQAAIHEMYLEHIGAAVKSC